MVDIWCPKKVENVDIKPNVPSSFPLKVDPRDSQLSVNNNTPYLQHSLVISDMLGTNPNTDTNNKNAGFSSLKMCSRCSKSTDKFSKLTSQSLTSKPSCIAGARSVAHATAGITILLLCRCISSFAVANISKLAEDPELQKMAYFLPMYLANFSSSSKVRGPLVSRGYVCNQEIRRSISLLSIVSLTKVIISFFDSVF